MLFVDVEFLPGSAVSDVAVVIDVLRMTSTATTLFARGVSGIRVVAEVDAARQVAEREGALLLGERGGVKLPGFDHGNSPLEFGAVALTGKEAVVCTTNGSKAVEASAGANYLLLGAIINDAAVAERALELAETTVTLVCSGTDGQVSLEDVIGAGCIIERMLELERELELSDAARLALGTLKLGTTPEEGVRKSRHAGTLTGLGFSEDVTYCARRGTHAEVGERTQGEPARFVLN